MIALMLDLLGKLSVAEAANPSLKIFHVDSRYSEDTKSIGRAGLRKGILAFRYALQALRLHAREGVDCLYFVPAPGRRAAFWRDVIILALLRPFFPHIIFHWHAAGLAPWLKTKATPPERWLARHLHGGNALSIVLVEAKKEEAAYFHPRALEVIPNGIPDLCPEFDREILPGKKVRADLLAAFSTTNHPKPVAMRMLYLSWITRDKGAFHTLDAWRETNLLLAARSATACCSLTMAGNFPDTDEEREFRARMEIDRQLLRQILGPERFPAADVQVPGRVEGEARLKAFSEADVFLFPSVWPAESFGLVLVEAAHFGVPCISSQPLIGEGGLNKEWHRFLPERDPKEMALAAITLAEQTTASISASIRHEAREKYSAEKFAAEMARIFRHYGS